MMVTFVLGTDLFSAENTQPVIRWIMRLLFGEGTTEQKPGSGGEGLLRKSAHFLEYGLLAFLWFRALRGDESQIWRWRWFLIALLATVLWATVDELQQGFISQHRTGSKTEHSGIPQEPTRCDVFHRYVYRRLFNKFHDDIAIGFNIAVTRFRCCRLNAKCHNPACCR